MPTPVLRLAALLLGLSGPPGVPAELPGVGEVLTENLAAHLEPAASSVAPEHLRQGDRLRVVDFDPGTGWLTVAPPPWAFNLVERSAVRTGTDGVGRVIVSSARVRVGIAGARMPGPPVAVLRRGAVVRLLDRPGLTVGSGRAATTWLAVAPGDRDVRYVRADRIERLKPETHEPPREILASFEREETSRLPAGIAAEVAGIEALHRAALAEPVERWQLGTVKVRYEALLKRVDDPAASETVRARLALVARHEEIARSARSFRTVLDRSLRLDQDVALILNRLAELDHPRRRPFVAEGLMQPSSRLVEGRRVYALIGQDGEPVAYLDVPPGLDARPSLTKRVGVRGSVRYNENLQSQLIAVKDLEPLE